MHRPIFGHSFAVLVAPILVSVLVFNFFNKKKASSPPVETNDSASIGNCYEVFLSFRGRDTRVGFTSHLYKELLRVGIHTFRDDDELPLGKSVGPELMAVIQNSKILIPILSVTYGTSSWCLDELVRIMECEKNKEQMVLPIFYKVKPSEVGHQIGSFGKAFREREKRLLNRGFDSTILGNWKKALAEVSKLKGYEVNGDEAELLELIVQKVLRELKKKFELVISQNLVGIDSPVNKIMEFVNDKSHVTLFVGIYGMGGIGKTTLAKVIYNKLSNQFECRSFIADIRESWKCNGANYLQEQLIRDISRQEIEVSNEDEGTTFVSSRFKAKKVVVLLDDVDNVAQLNCLAGNRDWFSSGSIIIITTRDKRILEVAEVDYCYEHQEMDYDQSMTLFSKHAFRKDSPPNKFEGLTREVVPIAGGLPLCLEVLGSSFCGREPQQWRFAIKKLEKVPPQNVQEKLRTSFFALDHRQKQIFLDIACLFIGTDWRIASYMWDACNFFPREGIEVLRFMSLIKVGDDHVLRMHDQLRDLGRTIIYEENQRHPQHRSRLWDPKEALKVVETIKGTDKMEAINLSKGRSEGFGKSTERDDDIYIAKQFKNLTGLRFLNLAGAHLRGDFEDSIEELRWLRWPNCPMNFEVKNFYVKKLAVLEMPHSAIDSKWEGWISFMMAEKLKFLDLSYCESLEDMDFLSVFKNLEVLILNQCWSLQRIASSIGDMKTLLRLELCGCHRLTELPFEIGKLKTLEQLLLQNTEALSAIPDSIGSLENLEILDISKSGIEELPNSIGRLRVLGELLAIDCKKLRGKMPSMSNLSSLRRLDVSGCSDLKSLSDLPSSLTYLGVTCKSCEMPSLSHLTHLKELQVRNCGFLKCIQALPSELPESLNTPFKLEILELDGCTCIETLDISQFLTLKTLSVGGCSSQPEVRGLDKLINLEELTVQLCYFEQLDLSKFTHLKTLEVCNCNYLVEIQGLDRLEFLEVLHINFCPSIKGLDLLNSRRLKELYVGGCKNLANIEGLDTLEFLEKLHINKCTTIEMLYLPKSGRLKKLKVECCKNLAEIQDLDMLNFLESLIISSCTSIERLLLPKSGSVKELNASFCKNLAKIQDIDRLELLEVLCIEECTSIERLELPKSGSMKELYVGGCKNLAKIEGLDTLKFLEKLQISK